MNPKSFFMILFSILMLCNCTDNNATNSDLQNFNEIIGIWVQLDYSDGIYTYQKFDAFADDRPGIEFRSDFTLIKRQNAGWCGTPPITYANFDGTWKKIADQRIELIYNYWGGLDTSEAEIITCNNALLELNWN